MRAAVVITGIGVLSPVGLGKDAYWRALYEGTTGFRPITLFDSSSFNVHRAGEIANFDPLMLLGKKGLRDLDRSTRLVCSAAKMALEDGRLEITPDNSGTIGVSIGATFGSLHSIAQFDLSGLLEGPRAVNPSHFPNTVINSPASQVSIRFKVKGFNTTISTGFCAGLDAISYAADFIRMSRAQVVLAGGVEELCEETFLMFHTSGFLSGSDGSEPVCCPFDARRNGIILSEGSAVLILENEKHALDRQARVLARVLGTGNSFDAHADPSFTAAGAGLRRAIDEALHQASLTPGEIDCVCASANSSTGLDRMETAVIRQIFGARVDAIPVTAVKSMLGETYSASGSLAVAAGIGILQTGTVPATAGYTSKDPECDLDYVPGRARQMQVERILVTASDPYGQNSAIILGK